MKRSEFFSDKYENIKKLFKSNWIYEENVRFMSNSFEINEKDELAHIMRLDYFLKLLAGGEHYLSALTSWEDPWEAKLYQDVGVIYNKNRRQDMPLSFDEILKQFFASCWSTKPDDLAMWQGYTSRVLNYRLRSVQVVTTAGDLFSAFDEDVQEALTLGAIEYLSADKLLADNQQIKPEYVKNMTSHGNMDLFPLFIKRDDFAHENEVRLVYRAPVARLKREEKQQGGEVKGLSVKITDMKRFVHKIILDPWCSEAEANSIKSHVSQIVQSHWTSWMPIEQSKVSLNNQP